MVDAGAAQLHARAVYPKTVVRVELQGADAEGRSIRVFDVGFAAVAHQSHLRTIQSGRVEAPALGRLHPEALSSDAGLAGEQRDRRTTAGDHRAVGCEQLDRHDHRARAETVVGDRRLDLHERAVTVDVGGGDSHAVEGDVHQRPGGERDIAVDAESRVPA